MKAFLKLTLFMICTLGILFSSCKADKRSSYKAYYQTINSEYAKIRAAQAAKADMGDLDVEDDFIRNDMAELQKDLAQAQAEAQAYKEAFERTSGSGGGQNTKAEEPDVSVDDDFGFDEPAYDNKYIRQEKVTPAPGYEGMLKKYNVVVASLSQQSGVNFLKKAFSKTNEPVVVVKNTRGLYYFVLGSYNNSSEAWSKRSEIISQYADSYSYKDLMRTYGIPFSDTWVLVNE